MPVAGADSLQFDKPVVVETSNLGRHLVVADVPRAAEMLLTEWPAGRGGSRHLAARKACLAVLEGLKPALAARRAFEAAAIEANILVQAQAAVRPLRK